jgi:formate/nitrite transporter FocA (FNT family)
MKHNLRKHEIAGLTLVFIGGTSIGIGLYYIISTAMRASDVFGKEMLVFPILFGLGILLFELGKIELKEIPPGKHR